MAFTNTFAAKAGAGVHPGVRLSVERLALARGGRVLFDNLSFDAAPGAFVELKGRNGSGKTSLLRAIAGFIKPDAGRIGITGAETPALALHLLGHRDGLKPSIDARAHVRCWAGLLGGDARDATGALERVGLGPIARLPARVLSQGQARRLSLARLLVAPRPIWLLDEPGAGLDAQGRELLAGLVQEHTKQGGIVLAAVHEPLGPAPARTVTLGSLQ